MRLEAPISKPNLLRSMYNLEAPGQEQSGIYSIPTFNNSRLFKVRYSNLLVVQQPVMVTHFGRLNMLFVWGLNVITSLVTDISGADVGR